MKRMTLLGFAIIQLLLALCSGVFAAENAPTPPAREGLLLEYSFEGDSADSSGSGRNGNQVGNPTYAEGRVGKGLVLDGEGDYIDCGLVMAELGQTFTVEAWVKPDSQQNRYANIFGNHDHGGLGFVMQQDGDSTNRFIMSYGAGSGRWIKTRPVRLTPGKWQHVALVKTTETLTFFLNGTAVDSVPATAPMAASPTTLRVGLGFSGPERCFRGCIDAFRVWNKAITNFKLSLSPKEKIMPMVESLRIEWRSVDGKNGDLHWEFALLSLAAVKLPQGVSGVEVAIEATPWGGLPLEMPAVTISESTGLKVVVDPALPPGAYTVTAYVRFITDAGQVPGEACVFNWISNPPPVLLRQGKPETMGLGSIAPLLSQTISLDGPDWRIAVDPKNEGHEKKWFDTPPADTRPTKVPWVIQDIFPGYHGVAWYWQEFDAPANPHPGGRSLLRFEAVDYLAEVWLNGQRVGSHEGGDTPFELDVTEALRPGVKNLLAVRVLNPTYEPIDGIALKQTASGAKNYPITNNMVYNSGGIVDSVALVLNPAVYIADVFVLPDWQTGLAQVRLDIANSLATPAESAVRITLTDARSGVVVAAGAYPLAPSPGNSRYEAALEVPNHRLWELADPALYRMTVELADVGGRSADQRSIRFGFRDFRFENGYFRLNGKRVLLKGSFYLPHFPVGYTVPPEEDMLRRDVLNMKALGYNFCRISFGGSRARQLDLFDELGVMVHQEHYGSWQMEDSPQLFQRWDRVLGESIVRDRNHPSVVAWGLLNETPSCELLRHAAASVPFVRQLDPTRMVIFNSGRFDNLIEIGSFSNPGESGWDVGMDQLQDVHLYPGPFSRETLEVLRTGDHFERIMGGYSVIPAEKVKDAAVSISEYGHCGSIDLPAALAGYERLSAKESDEGRYFRRQYEKFLADWQGWQLADTWARPEDYFDAGHRALADLRQTGETAIRSNPRLAAYSSTHCIADMAYCGAGSATDMFRQLKPYVPESTLLANAPLRWCLSTEPQSLYRGGRVRLDASLANEDQLPPGEYPARLQVVGPDGKPVFEKSVAVRIPAKTDGKEPPFAQAVLSEEVVIAGPAGEYRFLATMERGCAAKGGSIAFQVTDAATMPAMPAEVVLWGEDPELTKWLSEHGVNVLPFNAADQTKRQVILASAKAPAPGGAAVFCELARQMARGSQVVFLDPAVFADAASNTRWLPLVHKGIVSGTDDGFFRADRWAKRHPIFDGLPAGGMWDYRFYRNLFSPLTLSQEHLLPRNWWSMLPNTTPLDRPVEAVCGAIRTSAEYASGLSIGVWDFGAGRFIVNTLNIRGNLGTDPAAERLLRNLLNYAASELDQPVAELPADFDQQLKAIGYK